MSCIKCKENLPDKKVYKLKISFNEDFTDPLKILSYNEMFKSVYCYYCDEFLFKERIHDYKRLKLLKTTLTRIIKNTI